MFSYVTKPRIRWVKTPAGGWEVLSIVGLPNKPGAVLVFEEGIDDLFPRACVKGFESYELGEGHYRVTTRINGEVPVLAEVAAGIESGAVVAKPRASTMKIINAAQAMESGPLLGDRRLEFVVNSLDYGFDEQAPQLLSRAILRHGGSWNSKRYRLENSGMHSGLGHYVIHAQARFASFVLAKAAHCDVMTSVPDYVRVWRLWDEGEETGQLMLAA